MADNRDPTLAPGDPGVVESQGDEVGDASPSVDNEVGHDDLADAIVVEGHPIPATSRFDSCDRRGAA